MDRLNNCCSKHQYRPLACRTYFCLPKSYPAEDLRSAIINIGEDLLAYLYLKTCALKNIEPNWFYINSEPNLEYLAENYNQHKSIIKTLEQTKLTAFMDQQLKKELIS